MVRVLYVVGAGRSGTTIFGNILGSASGVAHVGELIYLWGGHHPSQEQCGCGDSLTNCKLWTSVLHDMGMTWENRSEVHQSRLAEMRMRHMPKRAAGYRKSGAVPRYANQLSRAYSAIADRAGASLVVDTSKSPADGFAAVVGQGVDAYVLQLVRDPRACAYSRGRRKRHGSEGDGQYMRQEKPAKTSARWLQVNGLAGRYLPAAVSEGRYRRVRYEDLIEGGRDAFADIARWVGLNPDDLPFTDGRHVALSQSHTVMGNPNRYLVGETELTLDTEWVTKMSRGDRWSATWPATPLLHRYGYELSPR